MKKNHELICKQCGNKYKTIHKDSRFCSKSCATKSRFKEHENIYCNGINHNNSYILGLIYSDGCLRYSKHSKREEIVIALKDKEILEKIHTLIKSKRKITCQNDCYYLVYINQEAIDYLKNIGLNYRKSKILEFPTLIPQEFMWDFIRGVFDGDGSVYLNKTTNHDRKYEYINASITSGSLQFLEGLQNFLSNYGVDANINKDTRNDIWYLRIFKQASVKKFYELMYQNAELYLKRKKIIFER